MKKILLLLIFFLTSTITYCQSRMKITFNNGNIKSGIYSIYSTSLGFPSKTRIVSKTKKEKYFLKDINNITLYLKNKDSLTLTVIETKKYLKSKKIRKQLGVLVFKGKKIDLYYVPVTIYQGGTTGLFTTISGSYESFVKRKNETISYNMGYIYGAGQRGIKKRVRDYFTDCPSLIKKVVNDEIPKKETDKIVLYYELKCNQ